MARPSKRGVFTGFRPFSRSDDVTAFSYVRYGTLSEVRGSRPLWRIAHRRRDSLRGQIATIYLVWHDGLEEALVQMLRRSEGEIEETQSE
jgi:hypothetical protein